MSADSPTTPGADRIGPPASGVFATTHWSVVLTAGAETPQGEEALARLCRAYWQPLYWYVRRRGHGPEDSKDLTQAFFARLLERKWISRADPQKGRFRSFLLSALSCFLADEWDKARAQKRGGNVPTLPLEFHTAETRYCAEPANHATPEQAFERRWAQTLLDEVVGHLRQEYECDGRGELFTLLHPCLAGDEAAQPYDHLARQLGVSTGTVKSAVHRLRLRYRQLLRAEIAHTIADPQQVEEELRHLRAVLSGG